MNAKKKKRPSSFVSKWSSRIEANMHNVVFLSVILSQTVLLLCYLWLLVIKGSVVGSFACILWVLLGVSIILFVLCDVYLYRALRRIQEKAEAATRLRILEHTEVSSQQRSAAFKRMQAQEDSFCQEAAKKLKAAQESFSRGDDKEGDRFLGDLSHCIAAFKLTEYCENALVNTVLNNKLGQAKEAGISVKVSIQAKEFPCDGAELCSLFSNILDNAIEACCRLPMNSARHLELAVSTWADLLLIECKNSASLDTAVKSKRTLTSKKDKFAHGWGLEILKHLAEKYEGELKTQYADGIFTLRMTLQYTALEVV